MKLARAVLVSPEGRGRTTMTDEGGMFDFTGLPAGRYNLVVSKSGYINLTYGQRRPLQPGTPLQLEDGQQIRGIEFRMPRGGVVSGTISDEVGDPMPGITVRVMRFQYSQGVRELVPAGAGQTDDRGIYRIWGLNPGEYFVSAVAPNNNIGRSGPAPGARGRGLLPGGRGAFPSDAPAAADVDVAYAPTYFPGVPAVTEATPVTLALGAEVLDLSFNVLLVRTARVSGRATNLDGTPVTAGSVTLAPEGTAGRGGQGLNMSSRIRWDGVFSIANVPPGRYVLRARGTDDVAPQHGLLSLTVAGDDLSEVVVVLAPGATVTGSVSFQGTPAAAPPDPTQVRVTAHGTDPGQSNAGARVAKDGQFTIASAPPGPFWIRAQAPRGWSLRSVIVDGQDTIDTPIDVRGGQRVSASLVFSDRQTELNGTIVDAQGRPITDYTVLAFATDPALWRPPSRHIMTARPDQNG
jgi:hypothetical protein